ADRRLLPGLRLCAASPRSLAGPFRTPTCPGHAAALRCARRPDLRLWPELDRADAGAGAHRTGLRRWAHGLPQGAQPLVPATPLAAGERLLPDGGWAWGSHCDSSGRGGPGALRLAHALPDPLRRDALRVFPDLPAGPAARRRGSGSEQPGATACGPPPGSRQPDLLD